jgi:hypothetical protein
MVPASHQILDHDAVKPMSGSRLDSLRRIHVNRIWKPVVTVLAAIYFLVDAVFAPIARRISDRVAEHWAFDRLRNWIISLRPYPTQLLFVVPVIVLEPIKPVALYFIGTGHVVSGTIAFVLGELVKLVLVERLFCISHQKLMSIPAFAWAYGKFRMAKDWLMSSEAWQNMRRWSRIVHYAARRYVRESRASQNRRRLSVQSR